MTPYRLLAVDIDGTLLDSHSRLPDCHRTALQRAHAAGLRVCLCTGRSLTEARPVIDQLELDLDAGVFVFGAIVSDLQTGRSISRSPLPASLADRVVAFFQARGYPILALHDVTEAGVDYRLIEGHRHADACERWLKQTPGRVCRTDRWPAEHPVVRLGVIERPENLSDLLGALTGEFPAGELKCNAIYAPNYRLHVVECFAPPVNKWHGLTQLLRAWELTPDQVAAVGDDVNDVEMIAQAGLGIAMGNAVEAVRAVARWLAPSHDACGLAAAVEVALSGRCPVSR